MRSIMLRPHSGRISGFSLFSLIMLLSLSAVTCTDNTAPQDNAADYDVYRPHRGVKYKTKLCMKCRHFVDAAKESANFANKQIEALKQAIDANYAGKLAGEAAERDRQAMAAAVGDPAFGTDPNDAKRKATDAALLRCIAMVEPQKSMCMDEVKGARVAVPDPGSVDGEGLITVRKPNEKTDPLGMAADPTAPFRPFNPETDMHDLDVIQPPFTLLEVGAQLPPQFDEKHPFDSNMYFKAPVAPPEPQPGQMLSLAELQLCVNEQSRQFVYSLFRGVVGPAGDIECVDIPPDETV